MLIGDFEEADALALIERHFGRDPGVAAADPAGLHGRASAGRRAPLHRPARGPGRLVRPLLAHRRGARMPTRPRSPCSATSSAAASPSRLHQALVEKTPRALGDGRALAAARSRPLLGLRPGAPGRRAVRGRSRSSGDEIARGSSAMGHGGRVREGAHADRGRGDLRPRLDRPDRGLASRRRSPSRTGSGTRTTRRRSSRHAGGRAARGPRVPPRRRPDGRPVPAEARGAGGTGVRGRATRRSRRDRPPRRASRSPKPCARARSPTAPASTCSRTTSTRRSRSRGRSARAGSTRRRTAADRVARRRAS